MLQPERESTAITSWSNDTGVAAYVAGDINRQETARTRPRESRNGKRSIDCSGMSPVSSFGAGERAGTGADLGKPAGECVGPHS